MFELSQWRNKTSTGGSNSTPKPKRSLLPFPSAEAPPPLPSFPSSPPYLPTNSTCYPRRPSLLSYSLSFSLLAVALCCHPPAFPLHLSRARFANNKTTPERRGTAAWRAFRPSFSPVLLSLSLSLCVSFCLSSLLAPFYPSTSFPRSGAPPLPLLFGVEAAAFRNASTSHREQKAKVGGAR